MTDSTSVQSSSRSFPAIIKLLRSSFWLGGNWKKALKESNLPTDVQATIYQVVRRSRLTRREKYDVAEELIHHFQDGSQQGISFDALTKKFGDPESVAMLIRRSKIRNRSWFVSAIRMVPLAVVCFSIVYLALFLWFHSGQANPTVDYIAQLNRNVSKAAAEDKAWPLYRPMWIKYQLGVGEKGKYVDMRQQTWAATEGVNEHHIVGPSDQQWPQAVEMIKQHQELLDVFRREANRKIFGLTLQADGQQYSDEDFAAIYPLQKKDTFKIYGYMEKDHGILDGAAICVPLGHFNGVRTAARMFHIDTRYAAVEGESERATENIEAVFGLANQITDNTSLVSTLIATGISRIGFDQLEEVVKNNPDFLSPTQLEKLQARLEQLDIPEWLDYSAERAVFKDIVQRCYTDDGNGDGQLTAAGMRLLSCEDFTRSGPNVSVSFWTILSNSKSNFAQSVFAPTSLLMCAGRKETMAKMEEFYSELEADRQLPFWESRDSKTDGWQHHEDFVEENKSKYILLSQMLPPSSVRIVIERVQTRRNAVVLALAMHRFHRQHGRWPKAAAELVGVYIEEFPVDIINSKPLRFKIVDDEPLIYSVGMDHDDDGGSDAKNNQGPIERSNVRPGPKNDDFEGDWILWPQTVTTNNSQR